MKKKASKYYIENQEQIEARRREYVLKNREKVNLIKKRAYDKKPEKYEEIRREWARKNKEKVRASRKRWRSLNAEKLRQIDSIRRSRKTKRKPAWFGELDNFVIAEAYSLAKEREAASGLPYEVDHLVPLISEKASGLHVAGNIQVIPAKLNRIKGNRLIMTTPLEWLKYCQIGTQVVRGAA
ncbi:MAG: hypothetical protein CMG91_04735 [Marinobacter sp.]|nr:hypothetical protein [Marinobacter sp.]MBP55383.1 hypothetical protein [Marinobacter sp.]